MPTKSKPADDGPDVVTTETAAAVVPPGDPTVVEAPPSAPSVSTPPVKVSIRPDTITTMGEVARAARPGFDAGGTPVVPSGTPVNRIAEIGDYPRSYEEAQLLAAYRAGEVDECGRPIERMRADEGDSLKMRAEES